MSKRTVQTQSVRHYSELDENGETVWVTEITFPKDAKSLRTYLLERGVAVEPSAAQ